MSGGSELVTERKTLKFRFVITSGYIGAPNGQYLAGSKWGALRIISGVIKLITDAKP